MAQENRAPFCAASARSPLRPARSVGYTRRLPAAILQPMGLERMRQGAQERKLHLEQEAASQSAQNGAGEQGPIVHRQRKPPRSPPDRAAHTPRPRATVLRPTGRERMRQGAQGRELPLEQEAARQSAQNGAGEQGSIAHGQRKPPRSSPDRAGDTPRPRATVLRPTGRERMRQGAQGRELPLEQEAARQSAQNGAGEQGSIVHC